MADFKLQLLEIGLEFVCWSSDKRNNFSAGSSEPKKDARVIWVWGAAAHDFFETWITCFLASLSRLCISQSAGDCG